MKIDRAKKHVHQALKQLMEALDAGKSEKITAYLRAMAKFHRYSIGNIILISIQKPDAQHVAGYRTWRKLGRYVRRGEKGIAIMAPIVRKTEVVKDDIKEEDIVVAFKTVYVFDISQTKGKSLPDFAHVQGHPRQYMDRLKEFIANRGIKLKYSNLFGSVEGLSGGGVIVIRQNLEPAEQFSVMVHELAHEILHHGQSIPVRKTAREVEAEATAFVVCQAVGLDSNTSSSDYIQLYDGNKETLIESLERVQKTAMEIIEAITAQEQRPEKTMITAEPPVAEAA